MKCLWDIGITLLIMYLRNAEPSCPFLEYDFSGFKGGELTNEGSRIMDILWRQIDFQITIW